MTKVNWHPYPKEKPPKTGDYLVTWLSLHTYRFPWVTIREFNAITNKFDCEDGRYYIALAWAEMPEPYKPEEPEDNHPDAITARKYAEGDPETVKALHIFDE